jgi:hypothetical protein
MEGDNERLKGCELELKWVLLALVIIFLLIILILVTKLHITLDINIAQDNKLTIKFRAWFGLIRYTVTIPFLKVDLKSKELIVQQETNAGSEESPGKKVSEKTYSFKYILQKLQDMKELLEHVVQLNKIIKRLLRRMTVTKFTWHTNFGLGDAAMTGMMTGVGWSVKGCIAGMISRNMKLITVPDITIIPSFQQSCFQTRLVCMIHFRIGYAILTGMSIVKHWKGRASFKTRPLSAIPGNKAKESL